MKDILDAFGASFLIIGILCFDVFIVAGTVVFVRFAIKEFKK